LYIACTKNHGIDYLQVHESYSIKENGVVKNRSRLIRNIGPLSRFDDGKPDYLKRLRQSFKERKPLIESLSDLVSDVPNKKRITISFDLEDSEACASKPKNIGYFLLDSLYDTLGIYDVLNKYKSGSKLKYDLNGLAKLMVFGRVIDPDSKLETFNEKHRYVFDVTTSDNQIEIYRALDCLHIMAEAIQKRIHHKITKGVGRNSEVCYYDVTNYYFEINGNDKDTIDCSGNIIREGLRKKGVSKENRRDPIVQMGLFIDDKGLPVTYRLFPGNHNDQTTLRPILEENVKTLGFNKTIIVADGGLNSDKNISGILKSGNGYIVSKSTGKSDKVVKKWILDDSDYEWNENRTFKVKSMARERVVKGENGNTEVIKEKLVCYWSQKQYKKELQENEKFIEYLNAVIANPNMLNDKPKKVKKFLKKVLVDKDTGEVIDANIKFFLNLDKMREYMALFGFYTIMTSELDKTDIEIIDKYRGLSRIEDSFRITKSDLDGRPAYVRTPEHINAHFLVCFIALTIIRLIQYRVLQYQEKSAISLDAEGWESGVTAERIQKALDLYQADALPGGYYRLTRPNEDMRLILDAFGLNTDLRIPTIAELRQMKYGFDKTVFI